MINIQHKLIKDNNILSVKLCFSFVLIYNIAKRFKRNIINDPLDTRVINYTPSSDNK